MCCMFYISTLLMLSGFEICGCALVFGRGTLYMKWGLLLLAMSMRHGPRLASSDSESLRTTTSHLLLSHNSQYFLNILFIIFLDNNHILRISIKTPKTRVNSTRFEAICSNFRLIGALFHNKSFYYFYNNYNNFIIL